MPEDFGSITIESPQPQKKEKKTSRLRKAAKKTTVPDDEKKTPPRKRSKKQSRGKNRKFPFITLIVFLIVAVALYTAAGFFGVPYLITHSLPKNSEKYTDLVLNIDRAQFNPFTFDLEIFDTTLTREISNTTETPLLSVPTIKAKIGFLPLFKGVLVSHNTIIEAPSISIIKFQDQSYNFSSDFEKGFSGGSDLFTLDTLPIQFSVNNITVKGGAFSYEDRPAKKTHRGANIEFGFPTIANSNNLEPQYIEPYFSGVINGSPIRFSGNGEKNEEATKIVCEIKKMDIPLYFSYLPNVLPLAIDAGTGSGSIEIIFKPKAVLGERFTLGIMLDAKDLGMTHYNQAIKVKIKSAEIRGTLQPFSGDLKLENLLFTDPIISLPVDSTLTDLAQLLPLQPVQGKTVQQKLVVQNLEIKNADIVFGKKTGYQQFNLQLAGYDNRVTSTDTTLGFSGKVTKTNGTFSWQGKLDPKGASGQFKINTFSIADLYSRAGLIPNKKDKGQGTLEGFLSFSPQKENSSFDYKLKDGKIDFTGVQLHSKDTRWLASPKIKLNNIQISQAANNLGDIVISGAAVNIKTDSLPDIFSIIGSKDTPSKLNSLQLDGSLQIVKKDTPPLTFSSVSLSASQLSNTQVNSDNIKFTAQFSNKSTISGKGRIKVSPFSLWLSTDFVALDSQLVLPWFSKRPLLTESKTHFTGKGVFTLPNGSFKGNIDTNSAHITWAGNKSFNAKKLSLKKLSYSAKPASLKVAEIQIDTAKATWLRNKNQPAPYLQLQQTLSTILAGGLQKNQTTFPVQIGKVTFKKGTLNILDQRKTKTTKSSFTNSTTSLTSLSTQAKDPVLLTSSGTFQKSPLKLNCKLGLNGKNPFFDATATFQQLQVPETLLVSLTGNENTPPFLMDAKIQQHNEGKQLSTITELTSKEPFPANSTVALILALNRDEGGNSKITFLTETAQPAKDLVLTDAIDMKLRKLMVKTEISPFLLSIKDFDDLVGKESVDFRFGEIALTGKGMETLIRLRDFLTAHPYVNLQIRGEASPVVDRQALQEQLTETEQQRVDKRNQMLLKKWNEEKQGTEELAEEDDFTEENIFIPLQPEAVFVSDDMLLNLAKQRAEIIKHIFTSQLALPGDRIRRERADSPTERSANVVHFKLIPRVDLEDEDDPFELER